MQCGPYVDLPKPKKKYTKGQYCYKGGADSECWGRSKINIYGKDIIPLLC